MAQLFANNISTVLSSLAASGDAVLQVSSVAGMPVPGGSDWFYVTLATPTNPETAWEIVKCTNVTGTTLTVVRAQGGTTAVGWAAGSTVELRPCSPAMVDMLGAGLTLALASPPPIGGTAPAAATYTTIGGTTITASAQFTGPGTGLTGTAASLTAGTANAVTWANVTGKPTNVSTWTNDAAYITAAALAPYQLAATAITISNIGSQTVASAGTAGTAGTCSGNAATATSVGSLTGIGVATPVMDSAAGLVGVSTLGARQDHAHPAALRIPVSDAAYTISTTSNAIVALTAITAARAWILPAASSYPGQQIVVCDESGNVSSTNTLTINRAGSDTIEGQTSLVLQSPYTSVRFISTGAGWTIQRSQIKMQVFTANGSWVCPAGVKVAWLLMCGAGGGGAAGDGLGYNGGDGGAGGQIFQGMVQPVPGVSYTVTIGTGGTAGVPTGGSGGAGTSTTFGALATATGGQGGKVQTTARYNTTNLTLSGISGINNQPVNSPYSTLLPNGWGLAVSYSKAGPGGGGYGSNFAFASSGYYGTNGGDQIGTGGTGGTGNNAGTGGGGGGGGSIGNGGNGGGVGSNAGVAAAANSGGGGGGGDYAAGGNGGGVGGSGICYVAWVE